MRISSLHLRFEETGPSLVQRELAKLWERYQAGVLENERLTPYESIVVREWNRCRERGVDPNTSRAAFLPGDRIDELVRRERHLLRRAAPILSRAYDLVSHRRVVLLLADGSGNLLVVKGHSVLVEKAANLGAGAIWSEHAAGNNGIGTAIHYRSTVHVHGFEHYCAGWHAWSCAGTPVTGPASGSTVAVVGVAALASDSPDRSDLDALVNLSDFLAEQLYLELQLEAEIARQCLIERGLDYAFRYPNDDIVVLSKSGRVVYKSPNARLTPDSVPAAEDNLRAGACETFSVTDRAGTEIGTVYVLRRAGSRQSPSHPPGGVFRFGEFLTTSPHLAGAIERVTRAAVADIPILITGETGTGKDLLARYIHSCSKRSQGPFVAVNCGAINPQLFEASFFGYERGAFTGADPKGRRGFLENAHQGTLFLDEIGDMPLDIQVGLLRALETGQFRRLGANADSTVDFRLVAATNQDLAAAVARGSFRPDLYYRLRGMHVRLPPLRERREDVVLLLGHFLDLFNKKYGTSKTFSEDTWAALVRYDWPGNARELKHLVEMLVICSGDTAELADLPAALDARPGESTPGPAAHLPGTSVPGEARGLPPLPSGGGDLTVKEHERQIILSALERYRSVTRAAAVLGIPRSTLYRKLKRFGITFGRRAPKTRP